MNNANQGSIKTRLLVIAGLVIIAIVVIAIDAKLSGHTFVQVITGNRVKHSVAPPSNITYFSSEQMPTGFPAGLPAQADQAAVIINQLDKQSLIATREYTPTKSLEAAFTDYITFFKNNNWTIVSKVDQKDIKSITATQGTDNLHVVFGTNSISKQSEINVTFYKTK